MIYHTYISVHIQEQFAPNDDDKAMNRVRKLGGVEGENEKKTNSGTVSLLKVANLWTE